MKTKPSWGPSHSSDSDDSPKPPQSSSHGTAPTAPITTSTHSRSIGWKTGSDVHRVVNTAEGTGEKTWSSFPVRCHAIDEDTPPIQQSSPSSGQASPTSLPAVLQSLSIGLRQAKSYLNSPLPLCGANCFPTFPDTAFDGTMEVHNDDRMLYSGQPSDSGRVMQRQEATSQPQAEECENRRRSSCEGAAATQQQQQQHQFDNRPSATRDGAALITSPFGRTHPNNQQQQPQQQHSTIPIPPQSKDNLLPIEYLSIPTSISTNSITPSSKSCPNTNINNSNSHPLQRTTSQVSELTMRSHAERYQTPQHSSSDRRMAYYAVGQQVHDRDTTKNTNNRRCYFTGIEIRYGEAFYAGSVRQGPR